jgi:hypothetical protein
MGIAVKQTMEHAVIKAEAKTPILPTGTHPQCLGLTLKAERRCKVEQTTKKVCSDGS